MRVNFDAIQEIGPKVGAGRSFVSGPSFARSLIPVFGCGCVLIVSIYYTTAIGLKFGDLYT